MFTLRTDVISLFELSKLLCGGSRRSPKFGAELNKLITAYPMDSSKLHAASSMRGHEIITHDEARCYCTVSGYPIPKDLKEPLGLVGMKQKLKRLEEDEALGREVVVEILTWLDAGEYISWPGYLPKPPLDPAKLMNDLVDAGLDCSKPLALAGAKKAEDGEAWALSIAEIFHELARQLRAGHDDYNAGGAQNE